MTITVIGTPGPQGSKRYLGVRGGRGILVESSAKVKPWREAVKWAVRDKAMADYEAAIGHPPSNLLSAGIHIAGAVWVSMTFTLPRPSSAKKGSLPSKRPDLSKLVRATEDALTDSGIWDDDSRVVECFAAKRYPEEGRDSLDVPGCVIRIEAIHDR